MAVTDPTYEFAEALITDLAAQISSLEDDTSYSQPVIIKWLVEQNSSLINNFAAIENLLNANRIKIDGFEFPSFDASNPPLWVEVLGKIPNLYFDHCTFECESIPFEKTAVWFDHCEFKTLWSVTLGKNLEALTEPGDALYSACKFLRPVTLAGRSIHEDTLGLYDIVFENCDIGILYIQQVSLNTRLYGAIANIPDDINADKFSLPKNLEALFIISATFKKPLELGHLHIGHLHLSRLTFEDSVDFNGLISNFVSFVSCNLNGSFSLSHAHAKQVSFSDCHFRRSAVFDFGAFEDLLFKTSSFEQILSLEYAQITDCIGLGSCSTSKPPNFLNCQLSHEVIRTADRETFRIIKNSFDAVGNNIEANRYFSYEMNAYLKELRHSSKGRRAERWLLELNGLISDHGQNYWRPLGFILILPFLYGLAVRGYEGQWLYGLDPRLDFVLGRLAQCANQYAMNFGFGFPKRTNDGIEFIALFLGVALSGLLWHFLVAVRRHKRR